MGSLPNLHELEENERRREKRREREKRRQLRERSERERESSRERERLANRLAQRKHSAAAYNAFLMAGLGGFGGGTFGMAAAAGATHLTSTAVAIGGCQSDGVITNSTAGATNKLHNMAIGGAALFGLTSTNSGQLLAKHHLQQRHSLTSRQRVLRTRSSGAPHNVWDEQVMEHLSAYSPISTRSHRINPVSSYQVQAALAASRRRESINSSIGANSIHRLISLNNRGCRHKVPSHVRQKVCRNFTCITLAHGLVCGLLLSIFALQGSNSIWHHREQWLQVGSNIGSFLLSACCLISAGMSLVTTRLIRKYGYTPLVGGCYAAVSVFLLCHLYPSIYTLLPAYLILGVTLSPSGICKTALIVHFGDKLSCSQLECTLSTSFAIDAVDEHKIFCNRDQKIRRLARWLHAAQDFGIILGAMVASMVLACTANDWNCWDTNTLKNIQSLRQTTGKNGSEPLPTFASFLQSLPFRMSSFWPHIPGYFDDFYNLNEHGERICGAHMCPMWNQAGQVETTTIDSNQTLLSHFINGKSRAGGETLIGIYLLFSIVSVLLSVCVGNIKSTFRHERYKGMTDTLLFAGPMAYFIGTEQAYMLGDFLRAFVSCTLGISMVAGALVGMGVMQTIVSCTLSMLLRHTKRIVVILAGFFFHSCLLLALSSWKPSSDDSALFYVLAASWGACNGMWETLLTALITINHTNHAAEVSAPLQALRYLGMGLTFAAHGFLCETPKIIILVIILVVSVPPYAMLEIRLETQRKAHMVNL